MVLLMAKENNPYVLIELAPGADVQQVTIYGRTDCCSERMTGLTASVVYGMKYINIGDGRIIKSSATRLLDKALQKFAAFY